MSKVDSRWFINLILASFCQLTGDDQLTCSQCVVGTPVWVQRVFKADIKSNNSSAFFPAIVVLLQLLNIASIFIFISNELRVNLHVEMQG